MLELQSGTRLRSNSLTTHPQSSKLDRSQTRDLGNASYLASGTALTFVNSTTKQIQAANGTFPATKWPTGMLIEVQGGNLNNGIFMITANDAVNGAYLTLDLSPQNEGPISSYSIRSL